MKTNGHKAAQLESGNLMHLETLLAKGKLERSDFGLYLLIADMLDEVTAGLDRSMFVGATKNRSAFAVYVNSAEAFPGLFGTNLSELSVLALDLL